MTRKEKYQKIKALREQGKTYQEIADEIGETRRQIQDYCGRHKELQYSEEERGNVIRVAWNTGKILTDFEENVKRRYADKFELVSIGEVYDEIHSERYITIRCKTCKTEKIVSSMTLRHQKVGRCLFCEPAKHKPVYRGHAQSENTKRIQSLERRLKTEKKRNKKKLKENQMAFKLCSCGAFISPGRKVCDDCKRKTLRATENRKETKRRMKTEGEFDKTITLGKLFKRDNGICYLCQKACDWKDYQIINGAFAVGKSYPTIEHVLAICNGGTHTWDNVKLACHACNSKKGKKLLAG